MSILKLTQANCKNCYKCIRNCPVKSIEIKDHQAQIIEEDCILCGHCVLVCPQNAKYVRDDTQKVRDMFQAKKRVVASVAPSFLAYFGGCSFSAMEDILKKLGFDSAEETAIGAFLVKEQYEKLVSEKSTDVIISTSCPSAVMLAQKHFPNTVKYLAPVLAPAQAHAKLIKAVDKDAAVVFIGPCVAKKQECCEGGHAVDIALTFEELREWMSAQNIIMPKKAETEENSKNYRSRFFPTNGGILKTMARDASYNYVSVDGTAKCMQVLRDIEGGKLSHCFVEMSACVDSCIGGPAGGVCDMSIVNAQIEVCAAAEGENDYDVECDLDLYASMKKSHVIMAEPSEEDIISVLRQMGKNKKEDELNCSTCGYATCREKAAAVLLGKADISMCLPYMKERAESLSDQIINTTLNAIVTVSRDMEIKQINRAALNIFGIGGEKDVLNRPVSLILDEFDFVCMFSSDERTVTKRAHLIERGKYLEQVFIHDEVTDLIMCIMKDMTDAVKKQEAQTKVRNNAAEITDKILEKQMKIVHEIASLLGETTAETQVALSELRKSIQAEDGGKL